jgi:tetratricopeptide (TPR) repeat protein
MVRLDGSVALADFGLARLGLLPRSAVGRHEVNWSAPEILAGGKASTRADIYSAGLILRWVVDKTELPLEPVIERAIKENPADRYSSATALRTGVESQLTIREKPGGHEVDVGGLDGRRARALSLARAGRLSEAATLLRRALVDEPSDAGSWRQLAFVYWAAGEQSEALAALATAVDLAPEDSVARRTLRNWLSAEKLH